MGKTNMVKDLSALTGVTVTSLNDIMNRAEMCISHDVFETILSGDELTTIDIGFGTLTIKVCEDCIKYKFEPSRNLEQTILEACNSGTSPLLQRASDALSERIQHTYKELI